MGGAGDPDRPRVLAGRLLEVDERLLPVGLVVVRARERRAEVVHEVEPHVVEHEPAVLPDDPCVVVVGGVGGPRPLVLDLGGGGRPAGHGPAQQERGGEPGVDEPGEEADARQPARRMEDRSVGSTVPARQVEARQRRLHQAQVEVLARRRGVS